MICFEEIKNIDPTDKHNWGPKAWKMLDSICDQIPCPSCKQHCHDMIRFEHDLVNIHTGKPLYDPEHFKKYLDMIDKKKSEMVVYTR